MLYGVIYSSFCTEPLEVEGLVNLLTQAREKNKRLDVTGVLAYHDSRFIQLIEGEKLIIHDLFNTICNDSRHHKVDVIWEGEVSSRNLSNWTMGFYDLGDYSPEQLKEIDLNCTDFIEGLKSKKYQSGAFLAFDLYTRTL